ncbi:MAG TPA: Cys-tRNA(Pro) deacylase [Chiayiivirga sp.]|nr:Cys-tRNA(Pro) deacylase [Chiayiivirga sp.]
MTPAIQLLRQQHVAHEVCAYEHDADTQAYGEEAVARLGLDAGEVFKTLIAQTDQGELLVAIVPVAVQLDLKALAHASGARRCVMAPLDTAQRSTGYVAGGISPLGQKKRLRTFIDAQARSLTRIHVSAGRRGLEVALSPQDLASLTAGVVAEIGRAR